MLPTTACRAGSVSVVSGRRRSAITTDWEPAPDGPLGSDPTAMDERPSPRCGTFGCTLPDKHAGLHCFTTLGKRERRPATQHGDYDWEKPEREAEATERGHERRVKKPKGEAAEPEPTAAQAKAQARAEGLVLVPADNATGFRGVCRNGGRFQAREGKKRGGKRSCLGSFSTPEAAALAYARHIGPGAAAEEQQSRS